MSSYGIYTLEFPEGVPSGAVARWPHPDGERDEDGRRQAERRAVRADRETLGVLVYRVPRDEAAYREMLFERYQIDRVAFTWSNDTVDAAYGSLYGSDRPRKLIDEYDERESCQYGERLTEYFTAEWGLNPWTIWGFWDERGVRLDCSSR